MSCHVERPLDDRRWAAFSALQAARPGGFEIAALMRPPAEGESESLWLARARIAAARRAARPPHALGRPRAGAADRRRPGRARPRARPRGSASTASSRGSSAAAAGTWTRRVAAALAELGYVDCTATAFRPVVPRGRRAAALARRAGRAAPRRLRRCSSCRRRTRSGWRSARRFGRLPRVRPRLLPRHRPARRPPQAALEHALGVIGRRRRRRAARAEFSARLPRPEDA